MVSTAIVVLPAAAAVVMSACLLSWYGVPARPVAGLEYQLAFFGSYPAVRDSELNHTCTVAAGAA